MVPKGLRVLTPRQRHLRVARRRARCSRAIPFKLDDAPRQNPRADTLVPFFGYHYGRLAGVYPPGMIQEGSLARRSIVKRAWIFVAAFALVTAGVWALYVVLNRTPSREDQAIRLAFNTWIGYSSFYIAEEKGIFDRHGIVVETQIIDPLAEKNAAMLRGDLDGMGGTIDSAIISAASGVPGAIVFMFDRSNGTDGILVTEEVASVNDLRGKRIAAEEGFVGHFFLLYILEKHGMGPDDIELVPMTTDQAGAAFAAGQVDVAVTWEPYLSTARQREGAHVLVSSAEVEPILADTLFLSRDMIRSRPQDVQKLVAALLEANEYWLSNPDECNAIVARRWQMDLQEVVDIMKTDELYGRAKQREQFGTQSPDEAGALIGYLESCAKLWRQSGVIDKDIDAAPLVAPEFVHTILDQ